MKKVFSLILFLFLAAACNKQTAQEQNPIIKNVPAASTSTSTEVVKNAGPPIYNGRPIFVGVLQISDNSAKGNLMLIAQPDPRVGLETISKNTKLYIQTQRNYSALVGQKVLVGFIGNANNDISSFILIDIVKDTGQSSFSK